MDTTSPVIFIFKFGEIFGKLFGLDHIHHTLLLTGRSHQSSGSSSEASQGKLRQTNGVSAISAPAPSLQTQPPGVGRGVGRAKAAATATSAFSLGAAGRGVGRGSPKVNASGTYDHSEIWAVGECVCLKQW